MNIKIWHKLFDLVVCCYLGYFATQFYLQYMATQEVIFEYKFDLIYAITTLFVMARRPDINTVTLGVILLSIRLLDRILLFDLDGSSGFIFYPLVLFSDILAIYLIWFRPVIFGKYGGPFKGQAGYAITNQDNVMWLLYGVNGMFMLLMTIEHATRKINPWFYEHSRILYNAFESVQFGFMVTGLVVLYYMTHEASKIKRADRPKMSKQPM